MQQTNNLGTLIDKLYELREKKRLLEAEIRSINLHQAEIETELKMLMEDAGIQNTGINGVKVSLVTEIQPAVQDWDQVYEYIRESGDFHLLHRRFSAGPYREMLQMGQAVPGVEPTEITKISMRKVAKS